MTKRTGFSRTQVFAILLSLFILAIIAIVVAGKGKISHKQTEIVTIVDTVQIHKPGNAHKRATKRAKKKRSAVSGQRSADADRSFLDEPIDTITELD